MEMIYNEDNRSKMRARLKKEIIQNNIYGVDIEEGAIEIARLRFWLSIVIDLEKPEALPNFDYKFMQGNSLLESDMLPGTKKPFDLNIQDMQKGQLAFPHLKSALKQLHSDLDKFYRETDHIKKATMRGDIKKRVVEVLNAYVDYEPLKMKEIADIAKMTKEDFTCDKFFLWHTWFADVFDKGGFDIVIGNPPYFQMSKGVVDAKKYPYSEGKDTGKQNIYKLFIELAYNLLRENGVNSFITQSSLMCDASSQYTRELLLKETTLYQVIEFPQVAPNKGGQLFKEASVATCIYLYTKITPIPKHKFKLSDNNDLTTLYHFDFAELQQYDPLSFYPNGYCFPLIRNKQFGIIEKMNRGTIQLDKYLVNSTQGDLNLTTEKQHFGETVTTVKLYRGCHVHRYYMDDNVTEYIQSGYKQDIVQNNIRISYLIGQQVQNLSKEHRVNLVISNNVRCLFGNSVNKLLPKPQYNIKMLLGVLNSKPIDWYFRRTSTNNHVNIYELEQLPIPAASSEQQQEIIDIVDKILSAKNQDPTTDTTNYERQIDALVYELYDITSYEELLEIEGDKAKATEMERLILSHIKNSTKINEKH